MVKQKKKILFIVTQSDFGGAQRYIFDLATNLNPNNFEIAIAAGLDGDKTLFKRLKDKNIKTFLLKNLKRNINPISDLSALFEIRNLIKKFKPDIIHLNSAKAGILGSLASYKLQTKNYKLIYTAHGWVFNEPLPAWQRNLYIFLEKFTAQFKDKIICVSDYDRQIALEYHIAPENKLITINNGINRFNLNFLTRKQSIEFFESRIKNYELRDGKHFLIGCVANLYPTKGLKYLIKAAQHISESYILFIIGDGPERKNLESRIMNYELKDKIFLLGNLPDAYQYLKAFDIFVLPSVKEGFPYVILEAMAAGLPIISTNVGGIPEVIKNDENGLIAPPKNSLALAKRINYLLKNQSLAKKLGKENLKLIKDFSLEKMVKETEKEYLK